ncbi:MAG: flagellar basal-body rod protein FlgG [Phycisphaerales bacterium]|nr:flagellar basal-body rod protein FlgG [Phycisphaerales bacterium]
MSSIALNSSATGLSALNTQLDVIANNLANASTPGFKRFRVNLEDLAYIEKNQPGVESQLVDATRPIGLFVGLGVEATGTQQHHTEGAPIPTGNNLDVMINGNGFFRVNIGELGGNGIGYTRAGQFTQDQDGRLVMANSMGYALEPEIVIPQDALTVNINNNGLVTYTLKDQPQPLEAGTIQISTFQNPSGLAPIGENLLLETYASGAENVGDPGTEGRGLFRSGHIEGSNVDPVIELVDLIRTQRSFEMNSQALKAADETLQTVVNMTR